MKQLRRDLWQSTRHQSGILNAHAYFLERPEGNQNAGLVAISSSACLCHAVTPETERHAW